MASIGQKLGANGQTVDLSARLAIDDDGSPSVPKSVVLVLDDSKVHSADLTRPWLGNPAIGGTEFNFVALAHELATRGLARITLIHRNRTNAYPKSLSAVAIDDYPNGLRSLLSQVVRTDCVVVRGHDSLRSSRLLDFIPKHVPVIAWTHNHLRSSTLSYLAAEKAVKRVVYVGREQCALAAGAACHYKSTYIPNGFHVPPHQMASKGQRAVYIGHLVPEKGFHRLARLWPRVRRACPNARLDVIGSSEVYQPDKPLGPLGVASRSYEKLFLAYLGNDPGKYGVVFHGRMSTEKYALMACAAVGLPNPTGFTECCPGSVLEMSACMTPVVAWRRWGMCDTVMDKVTGFLCKDEREYVDRVIFLLDNPSTAESMGAEGRRFVQESFSFAVICDQWAQLFAEVCSSDAPNVAAPAISGRYPFSALRVANSQLHSRSLHAFVSFADRVRGVFIKRY